MSADLVMLLIDADNVSLDVIEQAVAWVHRHHGGPHVRRAYCTAESAVKNQTAFKRLSIRPMVNLAAGKNSTDIALAVDAIDLVLSERPAVVVIASSDSDFAPLVTRLREKGCRVVGLGQQGKTGDETRSVYDDYEVLAHRKAGGEPKPARAGRGGRGRKTVEAGSVAGSVVTPAAPVVMAAPAVATATAEASAASVDGPVPGAAPIPTPPAPKSRGVRGAPRGGARTEGGGRRKPAAVAAVSSPPAPPAPPVPSAVSPAVSPAVSQATEPPAKPARKSRRRRSSAAKRPAEA